MQIIIPSDSFSVAISTFGLISLAEIGDKSQLVCMTLATRHRHWPILLGAATAFLILNVLAVLFGAGVSSWIPERVTAGLMALMFGAFGLHSIFSQSIDDSVEVVEKPDRSIFYTTLLLILVAEFGDKTQIAVAGLASSFDPWPVWLGSTIALISVSALGVWAGRTLLRRIPIDWLHRISGGIFLLFALIAAWSALV